ncbi:hypothetical protein BDV40DRAFT_268531 [Aspergillus tamarii]|uniref:Uncharacterized protein n=1 Tax=Aspergillus tamarii TaxID=41984 RepID=A0A5N6UT92_ASPTM|nr:hypothetical protein BDV40DRAFT_268531 [Aspergillus tamarii]
MMPALPCVTWGLFSNGEVILLFYIWGNIVFQAFYLLSVFILCRHNTRESNWLYSQPPMSE